VIRIPAEWEPHEFCLMAWAVHNEWGADTDAVEQELCGVIATIADYEPVVVLTPPDRLAAARAMLPSSNVTIVPAPVDDIWMRDIAPTCATRGLDRILIDWNFNGWGAPRERPSRPGDRIAGFLSTYLEFPIVHAPFIAEGGGFATNGGGVIITTKSCLFSERRNPAFGLDETIRMSVFEHGLRPLGGRRVIWLEGDADEPITNGHVDGFLMFSSPTSLLLEAEDSMQMERSLRARDVATLRSSSDCNGEPFDITIIRPPRIRSGMKSHLGAYCYANAYVTNSAVIVPCFGDSDRDELALTTFRNAFQNRDIRMLRIDHIVSGGGGIHCLTQPILQQLL